MNPLDDELRQALRRKEPPGDFTSRVLRRVEGKSKGSGAIPWTRWLWLPQFRWAAAAVVCLLALAGGLEYRSYQRTRAQGEQAREQVMLALQIASSKLNGALGEVKQVESQQPTHAAPSKAARQTR